MIDFRLITNVHTITFTRTGTQSSLLATAGVSFWITPYWSMTTDWDSGLEWQWLKILIEIEWQCLRELAKSWQKFHILQVTHGMLSWIFPTYPMWLSTPWKVAVVGSALDQIQPASYLRRVYWKLHAWSNQSFWRSDIFLGTTGGSSSLVRGDLMIVFSGQTLWLVYIWLSRPEDLKTPESVRVVSGLWLANF